MTFHDIDHLGLPPYPRRPSTVCIDIETAVKLATYSSKLTQVKLGADFYVGQVCYVVEAVAAGRDEDDMHIVLRKKPV